MEYCEVSDSKIVSRMLELKDKMKELKTEYSSLGAELQQRALKEMGDSGKNFKRFRSSKGCVTVYNKSYLTVINPLTLKRRVGADLFNSEVKTVKSTDYQYNKAFEKALKAIFLRDYEIEVTREKVYDELGADTQQRKLLDKKVKGDIAKDFDLLVSIFGKGDYSTEVFVLSRVLNWECIQQFFPDWTIEQLEDLRKCLLVEETVAMSIVQ